MSDPDLNDPVDDAYRRAEAVLSDDDARAARRARVLAAVTTEAGAAPLLAKRARRLHPAWMATAAAVALSVIVAVNIPKPIQVAPPVPVLSLPLSPPVTPPASSSAGSATVVAPQTADTVEKSTAMSGQASRPLESTMRPPPPGAPSRMATKPVRATPPAPSIPPLPLPPVPAPVAESPRPPPSSAPSPMAPAPPAPSSLAERKLADPQSARALSERQPSTAGRLANASPDPTERMRAAAAAGRTAEVEALLAQGLPVDAADGEGETALMKSVRADHPATAALLRRHGASLDHANKSGETVRDLAAAKADAQLDKALDLPR